MDNRRSRWRGCRTTDHHPSANAKSVRCVTTSKRSYTPLPHYLVNTSRYRYVCNSQPCSEGLHPLATGGCDDSLPSESPLLPLAGARGRGMRVETAQQQLLTRTGPQSHATLRGLPRFSLSDLSDLSDLPTSNSQRMGLQSHATLRGYKQTLISSIFFQQGNRKGVCWYSGRQALRQSLFAPTRFQCSPWLYPSCNATDTVALHEIEAPAGRS